MKPHIILLTNLVIFGLSLHNIFAQRPRELGIEIGIFPPGEKNSITDVTGVKVGHVTLIEGEEVRTGVTAILPHDDGIFQQKIPAAIYIGNGFGKLAGISQVEELGNLESPIILTNTLNVAEGISGVLQYTLSQPQNQSVRSVNAVVGETNDGYLNNIRERYVTPDHVISAIKSATTNQVVEGNVGAGTGTICFGYKGGIGSSSRKLPESLGGYTIGVLVQTNFGGVLEIAGVPIAKELNKYPYQEAINSADGSCMIVVLTDAPVSSRNLKRMAKRAIMGLAKTGGIASNGSGDYVIAASTYEGNRIPYQSEEPYQPTLLRNDQMTPLFISTIEATEEAIINSLFAAETMIGRDGNVVEALPKEQVLEIMKK
jgi:D-aminopeptidase